MWFGCICFGLRSSAAGEGLWDCGRVTPGPASPRSPRSPRARGPARARGGKSLFWNLSSRVSTAFLPSQIVDENLFKWRVPSGLSGNVYLSRSQKSGNCAGWLSCKNSRISFLNLSCEP